MPARFFSAGFNRNFYRNQPIFRRPRQRFGQSTCRPTMDGIDASKFLLGESETTGRDSIVFFGPDGSMMSVKAHNIKIWLRYSEGFDKPILKPQFPIVFDLGSDPAEKRNLFDDKMDIGWEMAVVLPPVFQYERSFARYPNIKPGEDFTGYKKEMTKTA